MRFFSKISRLIDSQRRLFYTYMGERALKKNQLEKAEKYLLRAASQGGGTAKCYFLLGSIAFRRGDFKASVAQFKTSHYLDPNQPILKELPLEVLLHISAWLNEKEMNIHRFTIESTPTSNYLPLHSSPVPELKLGDFTTLGEYRRFQKLPPITVQEIRSVDLDSLLKALTRSAS